jgi:hypothetical protein
MIPTIRNSAAPVAPPAYQMAVCFSSFTRPRPPLWLVYHGSADCFDLHRYRHRRFGCSTGGASRSHPLSQTRFSSCLGGLMSYEMPSSETFFQVGNAA